MIAVSALITVVGLIAIGPASGTAAILDPCTLLTAADLQQAFPGAGAGKLDRSLEKDGLLKCTWSSPGDSRSAAGSLLVFTSDEMTETPREEAADTWAVTFLDPLRTDAAKNVRYEALTGVGDQAVAVVEREDKAKGFAISAAILVVRRGKQQVAVLSGDLARRERAEALRILSELGKAIAKRLS
jgi:hypothetical protein